MYSFHEVVDDHKSSITVIDDRFKSGHFHIRENMDQSEFLSEYGRCARSITMSEVQKDKHLPIFDEINRTLTSDPKYLLEHNLTRIYHSGVTDLIENIYIHGIKFQKIFPKFSKFYTERNEQVRSILDVAAKYTKTFLSTSQFFGEASAATSFDRIINIGRYSLENQTIVHEMFHSLDFLFKCSETMKHKSYTFSDKIPDQYNQLKTAYETFEQNNDRENMKILQSAFEIIELHPDIALDSSLRRDSLVYAAQMGNLHEEVFARIGVIYTATNGTFKLRTQNVEFDFKNMFGDLVTDFEFQMQKVINLDSACASKVSHISHAILEPISPTKDQLTVIKTLYNVLIAKEDENDEQVFCIDLDGNRYPIPYSHATEIKKVQILENNILLLSKADDNKLLIDSHGNEYSVIQTLRINNFYIPFDLIKLCGFVIQNKEGKNLIYFNGSFSDFPKDAKVTRVISEELLIFDILDEHKLLFANGKNFEIFDLTESILESMIDKNHYEFASRDGRIKIIYAYNNFYVKHVDIKDKIDWKSTLKRLVATSLVFIVSFSLAFLFSNMENNGQN